MRRRLRGVSGSAKKWTEKGDAGEHDSHARFNAAEDVCQWYRVGDVGEVHGGQDGNTEAADDARSDNHYHVRQQDSKNGPK